MAETRIITEEEAREEALKYMYCPEEDPEEFFLEMEKFMEKYFGKEREEARKEKIKGGGFFQVLATYGNEEFEWWDYYACQKAAEDDVKVRVDRMREYDHSPLRIDKLEWVVEPF